MTLEARFSAFGAAHFRHHPGRYALTARGSQFTDIDWRAEPAVIGHRQLIHCKASGEEIPVPVCSTPVVIGSAGIIVAGYDGVVRFLSSTLTKEYWNVRMRASVYAPMVVDPVGPAVILGCTDGCIARLSLKGVLEWSVPLGELPIYAAPLILAQARLLVVSTFHGRCFGLDLDNGTVRFQLALPRPWHTSKGGLAAWRDPYASPAATAKDMFVQCCAESALLIDAQGIVHWERGMGAPIRASPAFVPGTDEVLVVASNGECRFIHGRSGEVRWGLALGARAVASPAVSGLVAAIGTTTGDLVGVHVERRLVLWRKAGYAPRDHSSVAVLPSGDFVVTTERGNAAAVGASDGAFLWETDQRLGLDRHDPKMDLTPLASTDGNLYCASYSGNVYCFAFPSREPSRASNDVIDDEAAP